MPTRAEILANIEADLAAHPRRKPGPAKKAVRTEHLPPFRVTHAPPEKRTPVSRASDRRYETSETAKTSETVVVEATVVQPDGTRWLFRRFEAE